jgi:hypothetical protein
MKTKIINERSGSLLIEFNLIIQFNQGDEFSIGNQDFKIRRVDSPSERIMVYYAISI